MGPSSAMAFILLVGIDSMLGVWWESSMSLVRVEIKGRFALRLTGARLWGNCGAFFVGYSRADAVAL